MRVTLSWVNLMADRRIDDLRRIRRGSADRNIVSVSGNVPVTETRKLD